MGVLYGISIVLSHFHAFDRRTDISLMAKASLHRNGGLSLVEIAFSNTVQQNSVV